MLWGSYAQKKGAHIDKVNEEAVLRLHICKVVLSYTRKSSSVIARGVPAAALQLPTGPVHRWGGGGVVPLSDPVWRRVSPDPIQGVPPGPVSGPV